jgi:hypothetical protein
MCKRRFGTRINCLKLSIAGREGRSLCKVGILGTAFRVYAARLETKASHDSLGKDDHCQETSGK